MQRPTKIPRVVFKIEVGEAEWKRRNPTSEGEVSSLPPDLPLTFVFLQQFFEEMRSLSTKSTEGHVWKFKPLVEPDSAQADEVGGIFNNIEVEKPEARPKAQGGSWNWFGFRGAKSEESSSK